MYAKAILIGRATKDCESVELPSGMIKANFSIAVNIKRDETAFFDLTAFDKTAEVCGNYVKKGKLIFAECSIQPRTYEDRQGNKRHATDYIIKELKLLSSDKPQEEQPRRKPTLTEMYSEGDDFIPF
jgi:single-strand DNA-binding protein